MSVSKTREVAEWSKAQAWKVCIRQRIEGSNPFLSAKIYLKFYKLDIYRIFFMPKISKTYSFNQLVVGILFGTSFKTYF
jgi:hypothetical protein